MWERGKAHRVSAVTHMNWECNIKPPDPTVSVLIKGTVRASCPSGKSDLAFLLKNLISLWGTVYGNNSPVSPYILSSWLEITRHLGLHQSCWKSFNSLQSRVLLSQSVHMTPHIWIMWHYIIPFCYFLWLWLPWLHCQNNQLGGSCCCHNFTSQPSMASLLLSKFHPTYVWLLGLDTHCGNIGCMNWTMRERFPFWQLLGIKWQYLLNRGEGQ